MTPNIFIKCFIFTLAFLFSNLNIGVTQNQDNVWLFGNLIGDQTDNTWLSDTTWGATNIDFNFDPPKIEYDSTRVWDFGGTNASICDEEGELLLYSNGQSIYDGKHLRIEDTINYGQFWENWSLIHDGVLINNGLPAIQGAILLPKPDNPKSYYLFYQEYDIVESIGIKMRYSEIEIIDLENSEYLITKDIVLVEDNLSASGIQAVKHANGRDWWLVFIGQQNNEFHTYLIDKKGLHNYGKQFIGLPFKHAAGQISFSTDGTKLGVNSGYRLEDDGAEVVFFDFDRCSGIISNRVSEIIAAYGFSNGICFSLDSRFAYASNDSFIYQYDLQVDNILSSRIAIATYDGFEYFYKEVPDFGFPTTLGWMGLAPNGKIYVSAGSGNNRKMHVIENPNIKGEDADVKQHATHLPASYRRTIPNFPNYRLGPLDNSSCDTLGLDNIPIAKFRFEQSQDNIYLFDFIDLSYFEPEEWYWEIEGTTTIIQNPKFEFSGKGTYEVCLTVSNEYGEDKTCTSIFLGLTDTEDIPDILEHFNIYPIPAQNELNIDIHDLYLLDGQVDIYNNVGQLVRREKLNSGYNQIDISNLIEGVYIYQLLETGKKLISGKFSKIK